MVETSVKVGRAHHKKRPYTRKHRSDERRKAALEAREERLLERAGRREYRRRYQVFFGCDIRRTLALLGDPRELEGLPPLREAA